MCLPFGLLVEVSSHKSAELVVDSQKKNQRCHLAWHVDMVGAAGFEPDNN
jgi:hypothetical protein